MEIRINPKVVRNPQGQLEIEPYWWFTITPETEWLKPLQYWVFETEELAKLAASMWFHFEEKNLDDFRRLFKFTLRALNYTNTVWAE